MDSVPRILVVAATEHELRPPWPDAPPFIPICCGVGPVDAAINTTRALREQKPTHVLHVGIAGARRAAHLVPRTLVLGARAIYEDLEIDARFAPQVMLPDPQMLAAAKAACPEALVLDIGTSGRVAGTVTCPVEAMEGFAVLRACALLGVPALEARVISNEIEEADRARWHFTEAFAALQEWTPILLQAIVHDSPSTSSTRRGLA